MDQKKKIKINLDEKLKVLNVYIQEISGVEKFELICSFPKKILSDLEKTIE